MADQGQMVFLHLVDLADIREAVRRDELTRAGAALPELTLKQQRFATEYLIDLNGTKAAIRAGYNAKTAYATASTLLKNTEVARQINALQAKRLRAAQLTGAAVLDELRKLAFSDVRLLFKPDGSLLPAEQWPADMAACVSGFEVDELTVGSGEKKRTVGTSKKLKLWDKLGALKLLAQHFKLLNETGPRGPEIDGDAPDVDYASMSEDELRAEALALMQAGRARLTEGDA